MAGGLVAHFNGRLELFSCDSEHAYVMKHDYEPSHNEELRRTCLAQAIGTLTSKLVDTVPCDFVLVKSQN